METAAAGDTLVQDTVAQLPVPAPAPGAERLQAVGVRLLAVDPGLELQTKVHTKEKASTRAFSFLKLSLSYGTGCYKTLSLY